MRAQFRQGDVFLMQIEALPKDAREEFQSERIVLAYGEATGHTHSVANTDARFFFSSGEHFLVVENHAELVHEEHGSIALSGGIYKVVRQREYEQSGMVRYVDD